MISIDARLRAVIDAAIAFSRPTEEQEDSDLSGDLSEAVMSLRGIPDAAFVRLSATERAIVNAARKIDECDDGPFGPAIDAAVDAHMP